jgi:hypothetical protein
MYLRAFGQAPPVYRVTLANQEAMRAATEAAYFALSPADRPNWASILEVPDVVKAGSWFQDPGTGLYYRGNGPFNVAYETLPPTIGGTPGTWQTGVQISDAEAAAWIARVEASRQPLYGSPVTLPARLGWTEPLTLEEIAAWGSGLPGGNEMAAAFFNTFATREEAQAWLATHTYEDIIARAGQYLPAPPPVSLPGIPPPPPAAPPPLPAAPPPPPATDYVPPAGYAPHPGTPMLQQSGWQPDEIGFWLTQAFGGDLALTEAFLLSFRGREELAAWVQPAGTHGAADVMARARAALAARRQAPGAPPPPEYAPPAEGGISFPMLALLGAGAIFLFRR